LPFYSFLLEITMRVSSTIFLLTCLLASAILPAHAAENEVRVPIPAIGLGSPAATLVKIIWDSTKPAQITLNPTNAKPMAAASMPPMVGELLRVEPSIPIAGARASWLAFAQSDISLCAVKADSPDLVCVRLAVPNLGATWVSVEADAPSGHFALRYRFRYDQRLNGMVIHTPLLGTVAIGLAHAIAGASAAMGDFFVTGNPDSIAVTADTCIAGVRDGVAWERGEGCSPLPK
jgi:hypothetical protein